MELHLTNAFADNVNINSASLSEDLHDIFVSSNLTRLTKLHLEQNEISKFKDKRVFCDLPNLMDLHLGDNLLKEINFNINCLRKLRFIDLQRNKFEYLKQRDMNTLDDLMSSRLNQTLMIDLFNNPLTCDCPIQGFKQWVDRTRVVVRNIESLSCTRKSRTNYVIDLILTRCSSKVVSSYRNSTTSGHKAALIFLLVVLLCVLLGLIGALIYVSKDSIKKAINPTLSHVTKKVQYTSIKDDEAPEQYV